jgi:hypothetical protein
MIIAVFHKNSFIRTWIICALLLFLSVNAYSKKHDSVFVSINGALLNPSKVKVLDLRGKDLKSLSSKIGKFENLEILLLGSKLRNLALYPPAWPYLKEKKDLPGGGYAHLQGRGKGKFYLTNRKLKNLPSEILLLRNIKVLDLRHTRISIQLWRDKLKAINPEIIILSYEIPGWEKDPDWERANELIKAYGIE